MAKPLPIPPEKPLQIADEPIASEAWDRVVASMPEGTFTASDEHYLDTYAFAVSLAYTARADITARGIIVDGARNPSLMILKGATDTLLKYGDRLGLARADHSRAPTAPAPSAYWGDLLATRKD